MIDVISCYFFLLLLWIPLCAICFIPAVFAKFGANVASNEKTGFASNKQLDAGAFGNYHRGAQQQVVKTIVDKKYGGSEAFDDDLDSDDDANMTNQDTMMANDRLQRMLENVIEKLMNYHQKKK